MTEGGVEFEQVLLLVEGNEGVGGGEFDRWEFGRFIVWLSYERGVLR